MKRQYSPLIDAHKVTMLWKLTFVALVLVE